MKGDLVFTLESHLSLTPVVMFSLRFMSTCLISINLAIAFDTCMPAKLPCSLLLNTWVSYAHSDMLSTRDSPTPSNEGKLASSLVFRTWILVLKNDVVNLECNLEFKMYHSEFSWSFLP